MRYLGLDLGTKTLGLAITDEAHTLVSPLKTIRFASNDYESAKEELLKIIKTNNISKIILGLPKNMDNTLGFASNRSLKFKEMLESIIDIPVILVDERLSTTEAEKILIRGDLSRKKRKKVIDSVAAVLILETYLKMEDTNGC